MFTKLIGIASALAVTPFPAAAACDYCTNKVVLTRDLASCLASKIEGAIDQLQTESSPAVFINLLGCPGVKAVASRGGQSIPDKPGAADPTLSLLLDRDGLVCLKSLVNATDVNWTPAAVFLMKEQCGRG